MLKVLLSLIIAISVASSAEMGKSGGGCILAQKGEFKVGYNDVTMDGVEYRAKAPSGKNFREIFVGSNVLINTKELQSPIEAVILDYKPNKRMKGKPKTGLFIVEISMDEAKMTIPMKYIFDAGVMKANAVLNMPSLNGEKKINSLKIWFETDVDYSLCYSGKITKK